MRGEHHPVEIIVQQRQGSSPHARGTRGVAWQWVFDLGIIPACAGNTGAL